MFPAEARRRRLDLRLMEFPRRRAALRRRAHREQTLDAAGDAERQSLRLRRNRPMEAAMRSDTAERTDFEALSALNDDYIRSVQQGDVRRFDEILAEDFLCSNPDGSLVDKRQFLAQIARPVSITGLAAHDVRVRHAAAAAGSPCPRM